MGRRVAGCFALACALATGAGGPSSFAAGGGKPPGGIARTADFAEKVNHAVDSGALWLCRTQDADGGFSHGSLSYPFGPPFDLGLQALAIYTLRSCGLSADDPIAKLGIRRLRQIYEGAKRTRSGLQNYQVSLTLLALDAWYSRNEVPGKEDRYGRSLQPRRNASDADLAWVRELATWITAAQTSNGSFGYQSPAAIGGGWEDHSNAQFSLLALKAARRFGVEVPKPVFRRALDHFLGAQEETGPDVARRERSEAGRDGYGAKNPSTPRDRARGWGYQCGRGKRESASGSMTTGGVSSLVICRGELLGTPGYDPAEDARVVQAIHDGIAWLGSYYSVTGNPSPRGAGFSGAWHFYYLYGLERAGVLSGVSWMGEHDWYGEGAAWLLGTQLGSGAWVSGSPPRRGPAAVAAPGDMMDTCFALLFLKKATFRVEGAVATEEADSELDLSGTADLDDASYRAVFDTVFGRYLRTAADRRAERAIDFVRMGTRAIPLLILRLEDAETPARAAAIEALEKVTGGTRGFRADDPVEARAGAVAAWEEWWFARRRKLAPDVGAGRFRD
jgi:hypothetical protein